MLVAPSSREGFGLTVLEALVVDTPVVMAADRDNLAVELLECHHRASVVEPDPAHFAKPSPTGFVLPVTRGGKFSTAATGLNTHESY